MITLDWWKFVFNLHPTFDITVLGTNDPNHQRSVKMVLDGARSWNVSVADYVASRPPAKVIIGAVEPCEDGEHVRVTVLGDLGGTLVLFSSQDDCAEEVRVDLTWATTEGFRHWWRLYNRDQIWDYDIVTLCRDNDVPGRIGKEIPLIDFDVPKWEKHRYTAWREYFLAQGPAPEPDEGELEIQIESTAKVKQIKMQELNVRGVGKGGRVERVLPDNAPEWGGGSW